MKSTRNVLRRVVSIGALLCAASPALAIPILGSAQSFAVLGASTVTNTGSTTIQGNLGLFPGPSVTGFKPPPDNTVVEGPGSTGLVAGPGLVSGTIYISHATAALGQTAALNAFTLLNALAPTANLSGTDLGTLGGSLSPGVYKFNSAAGLTGTLTLDFGATPDKIFVFQIGTDFTSASSSVVLVLNAGPNSGVYWDVGTDLKTGSGSATLGSSTVFAGNILAYTSISMNDSAKILCGRAFALNAAVTMITNTISNDCTAEDFGSGRKDFGSGGFSGNGSTLVPEPPSLLLLITGLIGAAAFMHRGRYRPATRSLIPAA